MIFINFYFFVTFYDTMISSNVTLYNFARKVVQLNMMKILFLKGLVQMEADTGWHLWIANKAVFAMVCRNFNPVMVHALKVTNLESVCLYLHLILWPLSIGQEIEPASGACFIQNFTLLQMQLLDINILFFQAIYKTIRYR